MRAAQWQDYELIDTLDGERLERWGDVLLIRPDPQIIWKGEHKDPRLEPGPCPVPAVQLWGRQVD